MNTTHAILFAAAAGALGCQEINAPLYFNGNMIVTVQGGGAQRVKDTLTLRFRDPSMTERRDLQARRDAADPIKVPWIARDNVHIEITYSVKNTDMVQGTFDVVVDGASEYIKYDEDMVSAAISQDDPVFLPLIHHHPVLPMTLAPGATYQGLFREDDFVEGEADLDVIDQFMAPFAAVLINRSDVSPIGLDMFREYLKTHPAGNTVPAMIEFDVTLVADVQMELKYLVRVRDDQNQLLHETGDTLFEPAPALFAPMLPPAQ